MWAALAFYAMCLGEENRSAGSDFLETESLPLVRFNKARGVSGCASDVGSYSLELRGAAPAGVS